MKHIPFAAFPADERTAVLDALRRSGIGAHAICVSKLELAGPLPADPVARLAALTAPGWYRTYETVDGWIAEMEQDLCTLRPRRRAQEAQS